MSFPSADESRRNTKPVPRVDQAQIEARRRARERAESEARIEEGSYINRAERRAGMARAGEKAQADYARKVNAYLPNARSDMKDAILSAREAGERTASVSIDQVGGALMRSEYPRGGVHEIGGKEVLDDTAATAGQIVVNELRKLGYTARVVYRQEVEYYADDNYLATIAYIEASW